MLPPSNPDGIYAWTEIEVQQYEERHPTGTKARKALALGLYAGLRGSDAVRLGPPHERQVDGATRLVFTEEKNKHKKPKHRDIRMLPVLRDELDASPSGHLVYLVTEWGRLERVRHRQNQKGDSQGSQKVIQAMSWVKGGQPWMTRPYSEDLRERVVRVVESGTSRNAAAKQFDVSISFVVKLMQRWKQRGTIKADKYGGWKKSNLAPHGDRIRALVMENCDITIDELCVLLAAEGIEAKRSTLGDFLLAQGLSRKKRQPTPPSRSALTSRRREPLGATSNLG